MHDDLPFRLAAIGLLVAVRLVRLPAWHLVKWSVSWPALKKDPFDAAVLLICGPAWGVSVAVYVLAPQWISAWHVGLPLGLRWAGGALGVAAVALLGWADRALGKNLSVAVEVKAQHTLATTGPYRWIRHPIYASAILLSVAMFLVSANWLVGLCWLGSFVPLLARRIPREEKLMIGQFGEEYRQYMKRTGRLIPRVFRAHGSGATGSGSET